jgi:hypothetical protein
MSEMQDCLFGTDMVLIIRVIELASKCELALPFLFYRGLDGQL